MKLYHGSSSIINLDTNRAMYFSADIEDAKQYALAINDLGDYSQESFIYEIEVADDSIVEEDDFDYFDCAGYLDYDNISEVMYNPESEYYLVKHPRNLKLIESYQNQL